MEKLSNTLIRSYLILLKFQIVSFVIFIIFILFHLNNEVTLQIEAAKIFIDVELEEKSENDQEHFSDIAIEESPYLEGLYIKIESNIGTYAKKDFPENIANDNESYNKIKLYNFFEYYMYKMEKKTLNNNLAKITIIKNLEKEKSFLLKIIEICSISLFVFILVEIFIVKYFVNKINSQITIIENINESINITSFDIELNEKDFFQEFYNIITSYKKMINRLKEQVDLQTEFVQNASHELKTPIFIISGYLSLIKKMGLKNREVIEDFIDSIIEETNSMKILTEKLLFLSNSNNMDISIEKFGLNELINEILEEFLIIYPNQEISYINNENIYLNNDRGLIKQLLRNILNNAIKYGRDRNIDVSYACTNSEIIIRVKDSGIGISKDEINKIFEKFYMVNKSREQKIHSHGLGLSIVKKILEVLNGEIKIMSKIDEGTLIEIYIPL